MCVYTLWGLKESFDLDSSICGARGSERHEAPENFAQVVVDGEREWCGFLHDVCPRFNPEKP